MADLIIKPSSGNSLVLQDEGGDAALTVNALGNVQAATTLGVTGNATLSGTANVYGAGTFPAGIVLQVVSAAASVEVSHNTTDWATKAVPAVSLVTKQANSKIHISGHSRMHGGSQTNVLNVDFRREITGGTSTDNISGETRGLGADISYDYEGNFACNFLDSPNVASGTTLTYKFNHRNHSGTTTHYFGHNEMATVITLMEIAV